MGVEQRFYSCALTERPTTSGIPPMVKVPAILAETGISGEFSTRNLGGDFIYLVAADSLTWAAFDAKYPNQDAQTGNPYRRRYPRTDLPTINYGGAL